MCFSAPYFPIPKFGFEFTRGAAPYSLLRCDVATNISCHDLQNEVSVELIQ